MPITPTQNIKEINEYFRVFAEHALKSEKASKGIAENFERLHRQLDHGHRTILDYLKTVVKLPRMFEEMSKAMVRPQNEVKKSITFWQDNLRLSLATGQAGAGQMSKMLDLEKKRLALSKDLHAVTGKQLAIEFITLRSLYDSIKRSGEVNESLINANSAYDVRNRLTQQIYETQIKMGTSMQETTAATRALSTFWPKNRRDFQSTLETVIQMQQGLGVSYDHAVQLARIFQLSLRTPVHDVADQIAIIANNTSLAADEATRFAIEVGKALRVLGPGGASQVKEVTKYVTMLAGRMQDVGGDAADITQFFTEMTKGTAQGFMLRGLSGVTSPRAIGTEAGSQAAFRGIDRMIKMMVTAGPGSPAYLAQLENASSVLHISTQSLVLWSEMMKQASKPLDEHAKLEQRWREQMQQSNKALGQVKDSFVALIHQAILPAIPTITKIFGATAKFVGWLASHQSVAYVTLGLFTVAAAKTIWTLTRLTVTLLQVAAASTAAMQAKFAESGLQLAPGGLGRGTGLLASAKNLFPSLVPALERFSTATSRFMAFLKGPALMVTLAAGVGYGLGTLIDGAMNRLGDKIAPWLFPVPYLFKKVSSYLGALSAHQNVVAAAQGATLPGQMTAWEVLAQVRRELAAGREQTAEQLFMQSAHRIKGLVTEKGAQGYIEAYRKVRTEMRERAGLLTEIVPLAEQKRFNEQQLELQQESVKRLGGAVTVLKESKEQTRVLEQMKHAKTHEEIMRLTAEYRMFFMGEAPAKPSVFKIAPSVNEILRW